MRLKEKERNVNETSKRREIISQWKLWEQQFKDMTTW